MLPLMLGVNTAYLVTLRDFVFHPDAAIRINGCLVGCLHVLSHDVLLCVSAFFLTR